MAFCFTTRVQSFNNALQCNKWSSVQHILSTISTTLPEDIDPVAISTVIDQVRAAADAIVEACDFNRSFESAFITRRELLKLGTIKWAVKALRGFSFDERLVSRVATVLALLGNSNEARSKIGSCGAVDLLTQLWAKFPSNIEVVKALVSLCAGHIHNVSRVMRQRGIGIAIRIVSEKKYLLNYQLLEQTLVLVGTCAICMPDNHTEGEQLVSALLDLLTELGQKNKVQTGRFVITALANIADCWIKEGHGYRFKDEKQVVDVVLSTWKLKKKCPELAAACCWMLASLHASEQTRLSVEVEASEILKLANPWKDESKTALLLTNAMEQVPDRCASHSTKEPLIEKEDAQEEIETTPAPKKRRRRSSRGVITKPDTVIDKPEVDIINLDEDDTLPELEFLTSEKRPRKRSRYNKSTASPRMKLLEPFDMSLSGVEDDDDPVPIGGNKRRNKSGNEIGPSSAEISRHFTHFSYRVHVPTGKTAENTSPLRTKSGRVVRKSRKLEMIEDTIVIPDEEY